jgi:8-oxo-dGTP diphosphatase
VTELVRAAGAVLWRDGAAGPEVAVIHRPRYDDWSLPKGKLLEGERHLVAALREVREETGFDGAAGTSLGEETYDVVVGGHVRPKTVRWWSVRATEGRFAAGDEVDELRWLTPEAALAMVPAARPLRTWAALPRDAAVVLLVRHASAGDSSAWTGPDELRPLDRKGIRQAELLAEVLGCYRPVRLVSAPPVRCQATVAPLAAALGARVEIDALLGEEGAPADPERQVVSLARSGESVVLCSQGGVIPRVLRALGVGSARAVAEKGSVWVLTLHGGRLLTADDSVLT